MTRTAGRYSSQGKCRQKLITTMLPLLTWVLLIASSGFFSGVAVAAQGGAVDSEIRATYNGLITLGSLISLFGSIAAAGTVIVKVTNSINGMESKVTNNITTTSANLREQLICLEREFTSKLNLSKEETYKLLTANREELSILHRKLEAGLNEMERSYEKQDNSLRLLEKDFVQMKMEWQGIMRSFENRLQNVEHYTLRGGHRIRQPEINEDIEGF